RRPRRRTATPGPGTAPPGTPTATPAPAPGSPRAEPRRRAATPTARRRSRSLRRGVGVRALELGAEDLLVELPHARLGDLVDELHPLRQPPLRELRRDELDQLVAGGLRALLQHHTGHRPLAPPLVGHRDHR